MVQALTATSITLQDLRTKFSLQLTELDGRLWVLAIESKQADFSLEAGLTQTLTYLLANPSADRPSFGMISNGRDFQFIKLSKLHKPKYAFSRSFDLRNPGNDLQPVLRILKRLAQLLKS